MVRPSIYHIFEYSSIRLSEYPSTYQTIHHSICHHCIRLFFIPLFDYSSSLYSPIPRSVFPFPISLTNSLFVHPSDCPSICLHIHPFDYPFYLLSVSIQPNVHLLVHPFIRLLVQPIPARNTICPSYNTSIRWSIYAIVRQASIWLSSH